MVIYCETHPNKTLEKLNFQRISSEFTDIAVIVAGRHFSLHKSLLAAHSSLFCSVLKDDTSGQTPNIDLDGVELEYFSRIIDFIYTAKLDITPENMEHLHITAQFLQIQGVIDLCNQFKKQEKEVLAQQLTDRTIKVESFIKRQNPATISVLIQQQDESIAETIVEEQVLSSENSVEEQRNQVDNMMIEVCGSRDGSLANEGTKLRFASPETQDPDSFLDEEDQGSKVRKKSRTPLKMITCQICNKSFRGPKYEAHKRLHTAEKPFACKTCNKQFVTAYNLKTHERIHAGERPYDCNAGIKTKQCDICKKNFATATQVREHRRSHMKEKPYECPECGKAYGYHCDLKRHMREHTESASEMRMNVQQLAQGGILTNVYDCMKFLRKHRLLASEMNCPICSSPMREGVTEASQDGCRWRCRNSSCKTTTTIRKGSFFEKSRVGLPELVLIIYFWTMDLPQRQIAYESGVSERTIVEWANFLREICSSDLTDKEMQIGGPGHIVSIDETQVAHSGWSTNGQGRPLKELWLCGGIDHSTKKVFIELVPEQGRTAPVLEEMITRHVAKGTTIWTDNFASYKNIEGLGQGYVHKTVNHCKEFVTVDGIHTNSILNLWSDIKKKFKRMNGVARHVVPSYLDEWLWRRQHPRTRQFLEILMAIANNPRFDVTERLDQKTNMIAKRERD